MFFSVARCRAISENCFVTSDEDRTVRIWQNGENVESIQLPAQSVWSVASLSNGDIVTGSSDGIVRIFTQNENRYADEATLNKFNEEVEALTRQSTQEIGGYKISEYVYCTEYFSVDYCFMIKFRKLNLTKINLFSKSNPQIFNKQQWHCR